MIDLIGTIFEALDKPMPNLSHLTPENQALTLFNALNVTDQARLVVVDQFENLLDWQTGHALVNRPGIGEWLDALNSQPCRCKIVLTSRLCPQGANGYLQTYIQEYRVQGLKIFEGIELLRRLEIEALEADLRRAVILCDGHALSLTLLASILRRNPSLKLKNLFDDPTYAQLWRGDIARNLLDYIYKQQLTEIQRKLLLAFSVYREPVTLYAAQTLIDFNTNVSEGRLLQALDVLLAQHLLQPVGELRYQLHTIVASYAQNHFVEGDEQANQQELQTAHSRAAEYYVRLSRLQIGQRQSSSDVQPLIEATWQLLQAGKRQDAYKLVQQEDILKYLL